jgi:hypothetical protein
LPKSKKETVNKSQAIRDALQAHPDKSPAEIAESLKAKGLDISAQYVSTIRSNAKTKERKTKIVRRRNPGKSPGRNGFGTVQAALHFIREAGGLDQARQALQTVDEIQHALAVGLPSSKLWESVLGYGQAIARLLSLRLPGSTVPAVGMNCPVTDPGNHRTLPSHFPA